MTGQHASLCHDPMLSEYTCDASDRLLIIHSSQPTKMVLWASLLCQHASSDYSHKCNNALESSREHLMRGQRSSAFNLTQCMSAQSAMAVQQKCTAVVGSTSKQQCSAAARVPF